MISIVIPIYNAEKQLTRCLDSIERQTLEYFEVLLIDDGSTDNSKDVCKLFVKKDSRFKYFYQDNLGPDMARKTGTSLASGEYITYVDADDLLKEDALEVLYTNASKKNVDIVCGQIVRFDERKEWPGSKHRNQELILKEKKEILSAFFTSEILIGTYYAKLIRLQIMKEYEFLNDGLIGEDITAALWMFNKAKSIMVIPSIVYCYYQNSNSISHAKYTYRHLVSLKNYIRLRDEYLYSDINYDRICGYFAGYQMAVATAMGRSGKYEKTTGELLRTDLKERWKNIRNDEKTALYMKMCIFLYIHAPKIFVRMYRILYIMTGR